MTAYNIIKSLSRRGNTVIGAGCYAAAIEYRSDTNKIIKIGNNIEDPWLDYYRLIIKTNQHNPCVPSVYSMYIDYKHNFYVCTMEKLNQWCESKEYENQAKKLISEYAENKISKDDFIDSAVSYPKAIPSIGAMLHILDQIKDTEDCDSKHLDLHGANILSRASGALVVTDPWCQGENTMEDISGVEEWVSDILGV